MRRRGNRLRLVHSVSEANFSAGSGGGRNQRAGPLATRGIRKAPGCLRSRGQGNPAAGRHAVAAGGGLIRFIVSRSMKHSERETMIRRLVYRFAPGVSNRVHNEESRMEVN